MNEFQSQAPGNASAAVQANGETTREIEDVNSVSRGSCLPFLPLTTMIL